MIDILHQKSRNNHLKTKIERDGGYGLWKQKQKAMQFEWMKKKMDK